jgi:hypothetical protein
LLILFSWCILYIHSFIVIFKWRENFAKRTSAHQQPSTILGCFYFSEKGRKKKVKEREYLVISVKKFDFVSVKGERVQGMQVFYLDDFQSENGNQKGKEIVKISGPAEVFHDFSHVPGMYRLNFSMRPGSGGKVTVRVQSAQFISAVDFVSGTGVDLK